MFGHADSVSEEALGDGQLIYIKGCKTTSAQTIVIRGANDFMIDEIDRYDLENLSVCFILSVFQIASRCAFSCEADAGVENGCSRWWCC